MQLTIDLTSEQSMKTACENAFPDDTIDLVIVASGVLHADGIKPEKTWRRLNAETMMQVFAVNTIGPAVIARYLLDRMEKQSKSVFAALSARVGSISDNGLGGWHSYRASKAALNMLIRNFAIELKHRNPGAFAIGLHPGTVDTPLSEPFQPNVPRKQLFTADVSADHLLKVIDTLAPDASGNLFAWDGAIINS